MGLIHWIAQPIGWGARAVGSAQNILPGQGDSSLNQVGRAITSGTSTLSNPGGLFTGDPAFTEGPASQGATSTSGGDSGGVVQPSSTYSGSYSGGDGSSYVDPAVAAFLGLQIGNVQEQINALDPQLQVGLGNIGNSFNQAVNRENLSFGQAERDYGTRKTQNIEDQMTAKRDIDTAVRGNTNALQRLLGLAGSGRSSAAQLLAPYAAGRQGNIARGQVQRSYGRNMQGLDTAWGDTQQAHKGTLEDIEGQRFRKENELRGGIDETRASLLQTLAGLTLQQAQAGGKSLAEAQAAVNPYTDQVRQIIGRIAGYGQQFADPISLANPSVYRAPDLEAYNYDIGPPPVYSTDVTYGNQISPYLSSLFGDRDRERLTFRPTA